MRYGRTLREVPGAIGDALGKDIPGLVGFVLSSVAFGYAAMIAKDISKGRDPRSPLKMETWLAAIVQSGGAGILGDFLFGKVNRFGNSLGDTVIGPTVELVNKGFTVAGQLVCGEFENAGENALRTLTANAPFINMWYMRAALDWLLLYHIQEMLSPGSLARMERKMKQEYNQSYLVSPSENIKRGGGWR